VGDFVIWDDRSNAAPRPPLRHRRAARIAPDDDQRPQEAMLEAAEGGA